MSANWSCSRCTASITGLPITSVKEIIRYVPPSATATASGEIKGLINLRGRTLPIVDLSGRLGG